MIASSTRPGAGADRRIQDRHAGSRFTSLGKVARNASAPSTGAGELRDPVDAGERRCDPPRDEEAEGDRGVEVAAGDVARRPTP